MPTPKATPHNQRSLNILTASKRERVSRKAYNAALRTLETLDPLSKEYSSAQETLLTTTTELLDARRALRATLAGATATEGDENA